MGFYGFGPQLTQMAGADALDVIDFGRGDSLSQEPEHRLDQALRPRMRQVSAFRLRVSQELVHIALLDGLAARIAAFVVEAADEHPQLGAELGGFAHSEPVTEHMQHGDGRHVGVVASSECRSSISCLSQLCVV